MSEIIDLMLAIRKDQMILYHRDTNSFDFLTYSERELEELSPEKQLPLNGTRNSIMLPTYEVIDHKEIMRFFVREFVEEKENRKVLFHILRRMDFMDAYLEKLRELQLYDEFIAACGDIYIQIFSEWAAEHELKFQ